MGLPDDLFTSCLRRPPVIPDHKPQVDPVHAEQGHALESTHHLVRERRRSRQQGRPRQQNHLDAWGLNRLGSQEQGGSERRGEEEDDGPERLPAGDGSLAPSSGDEDGADRLQVHAEEQGAQEEWRDAMRGGEAAGAPNGRLGPQREHRRAQAEQHDGEGHRSTVPKRAGVLGVELDKALAGWVQCRGVPGRKGVVRN